MTNYNGRSIIKASISLGLFMGASFCNALALAWVHDLVPYEYGPLPDIWFRFSPYSYPAAIQIAEWIIVFSVIGLIIMLILHSEWLVLIRRLLAIASLCYFCRAVTICTTQLPVPSVSTYCAPVTHMNKTQGLHSATLIVGTIFRRAYDIYAGFGLNMFHSRAFCGDLVFSGHTIILFLCYNMFRQYLPKNMQILAFFSKMANFLALACILIARKHYTLDVILAYWITNQIFWIYHAVTVAIQNDRADDYQSKSIFYYRLIVFLEYADYEEFHDLDGRQIFRIPSIWPRFCRNVSFLRSKSMKDGCFQWEEKETSVLVA